ncbi:hypothetical protein GLX27_000258 [Malassezia furfur]|uniref:NADH dehydrogenase [ubiquinone] 1 beta subcomplex subunit 11, mitochondrial n=1 Tax=Malassezia furfur TaxID=55194 RepID=A0ABY8EJ14_MALFU|nr:hypothetical protein GLX27_000258 [Malassezia furfur]
MQAVLRATTSRRATSLVKRWVARLTQPPAPGQKREKAAWERLWYWGFYGGMAAFGVLLYYKPDKSVRQWATPEAEKRLDESGLPWRYKPSPNSGYPEGIPK